MTRRLLTNTLTAGLLLCAVSAQAQEVPRLRLDRFSVVVGIAGQAADGITTYRFLHNGSGCLESNTHTGPTPAAGRIVLMSALNAGAVIGLQYALVRLGPARPITKWTSRALGYFSGATGVQAAIHNQRACGW